MEDNNMLKFLDNVLQQMPSDWLNLTTHRLDIYEEQLAKTQFLDEFKQLYVANDFNSKALSELPTAYDYIRLGHPLSSILEWAIAESQRLKAEQVISFSSRTFPILAILRKNLLSNTGTQVCSTEELSEFLDVEVLRSVYGYNFDLKQVARKEDVEEYDGSTVFVSKAEDITSFDLPSNIDFHVNILNNLGSILIVNSEKNEHYIPDIQHVRRRETIAMTPADSHIALQQLIAQSSFVTMPESSPSANKASVITLVKDITGANTTPLVASSGLSIQYAIVMGLIHDAIARHEGKAIKIVVPPNCYGGTNDQARRVAACIDNVTVVDLPVDGDNDMVRSVDTVLNTIAQQDAVPLIIAEIPTNPRVEVPDLVALEAVLSKQRKTAIGAIAIEPIFILDQTFCPNTPFLGEGDILSAIKTIAYISGSKFPSGGRCTAGFCIANKQAEYLLTNIASHLNLCDNEATHLQYEILAAQLPSMIQRIRDAYANTRDFVNFINATLPDAKINFVSEELAEQGFTPSVFSLDLPTKGDTDEEREAYKRELNLKLINLMITKIPKESKYCVSYGQLKGCYWTIPATSTQGTTKEGDKDYIARVALSPDMDLDLHKKIFLEFIEQI